MTMKHILAATVSVVAIAIAGTVALAAGQYGPGASDKEIKIGNTIPYSGPASAYGAIGKGDAAYFAMINDHGGVNGRKINFISRDDGYSPPKTVEQVRKLVEEDNVLALFNTLGTPPNTAIQGYLNDNKVPQLFVSTGADKWNDPKNHPWTMGYNPSYRVEARIYGRYILKNIPDAKIAVLYQNDDFGKDYLAGLKDALGDKADKMIVMTKSYETTDPTVDSQVVALQGSGANVMITAATPKWAAQSIRKVGELGWKPTHFVTNVSVSVGTVLTPAGLDKSVGLITSAYVKDPTDAQWKDSKDFQDWTAWMKKYYPDGNLADANIAYAYGASATMVQVLKQCGDNLTRDNVMKQAANLKNFAVPMVLPGITISTGPDDYAPFKQMQLAKFDGHNWKVFGDLISGGNGS
ncbi:MAG TPA: ABC transporter substrate-binding protein [Magnetospirillaceae bacterium]|jgi:branched-chain amino acid transport system substrate-binding protein